MVDEDEEEDEEDEKEEGKEEEETASAGSRYDLPDAGFSAFLDLGDATGGTASFVRCEAAEAVALALGLEAKRSSFSSCSGE